MRQERYRALEECSEQGEYRTLEKCRENVEYRAVEECRTLEMPYEFWLCSFPDISNRALFKLIDLCGSAREAYFANADRWRHVLKEKQVESLKRFTESWKPEEEYRKLKEQGVRLITFHDEDYPERLREIPDMPYGLFVRGSLPGEEPAVAVIGARDCSGYGSFVAEKLGEVFAKHGITVVSGMARGVDGISQLAALDAGGRSCGVLGCGVDVCYPRQNRDLYERLPKQGCLISSYPMGTPALSRNFPPRNRIVSGLADAVVVVEAREKSGTLITVDMALEQGREVYAVPGRVTDRLSDGCNRLIRQGAIPMLNPEELIEELKDLQERRQEKSRAVSASEHHKKARSGAHVHERNVFSGDDDLDSTSLSPELATVYKVLSLTPKNVEEIRESLPDKYRDINLNACLIRLCLEGKARQVSPGCFCIAI